METKLNIAEILKDKPKNTKLYSLLCGDCWLVNADYNGDEFGENFPICVSQEKDGVKALKTINLTAQGMFFENTGECMLLPSKEMRNWEKFAWKRGDILSCGDSTLVFKEWLNDSYTRFCGVHEIVQGRVIRQYIGSETEYATCEYDKETDSEKVGQYLRNVEYEAGGKFNPETLEIEKSTFKDGDIVHFDLNANGETIAIFKEFAEDGPMVYASYFVRSDNLFAIPVSCLCKKKNINKKRLATEQERELIMSKLANIGHKWNPETKQIEDLPKSYTFKPFDKVLVRDYEDGEWYANIFSHVDESDEYRFNCIQGCWQFCIPYEGNEHLLGTANDPNQ